MLRPRWKITWRMTWKLRLCLYREQSPPLISIFRLGYTMLAIFEIWGGSHKAAREGDCSEKEEGRMDEAKHAYLL